ncbi:MAG: hypothetical protein IIA34_00435 [Proteobacteria bacterium]|nr:hypothetical protein [Pseudomonadota bacterium]
MRQLTLAAVVAAGLLSAGAAALLTTGAARAAESWGLPGEEIVRFEAKVVDLLCELTGDCPAQCGAGTRQLGLLKDDGTLVLPLKNQTFFSGAVDELIDFCAKRVVADGLMVTNRGYTIFALQFVKAAPDGKWRRADRFPSKWAKRNGLDPKDKKVQRWFENDPRVEALIARDGKLGLGLEADRKFLEAQ